MGSDPPFDSFVRIRRAALTFPWNMFGEKVCSLFLLISTCVPVILFEAVLNGASLNNEIVDVTHLPRIESLLLADHMLLMKSVVFEGAMQV